MPTGPIDYAGFAALLGRLAVAWEAQDAEAAADCFTEEAVYMEPPDQQLFRGRSELTAYFSPLKPGTFLEFQGIWFDVGSQRGAAEFSFGVRGAELADHGVAIVQVEDGLIASWREYHVKGPVDFAAFVAADGKQWEWHIGNYP